VSQGTTTWGPLTTKQLLNVQLRRLFLFVARSIASTAETHTKCSSSLRGSSKWTVYVGDAVLPAVGPTLLPGGQQGTFFFFSSSRAPLLDVARPTTTLLTGGAVLPAVGLTSLAVFNVSPRPLRSFKKRLSLSPPSSFSLLRRHATIAHLLLLLVLVFDSRMSTRFLWLARQTKRDLLVVQKPVPFIY
jgi:hypothetical protein